MLPFEIIGQARLHDGSEFTLVRRGDEWVLRAGTSTLMSSRTSASEVNLAEQALRRCSGARDVLVGGLGLGYTLRAVLDRVEHHTKVTVAELVPELIEWHRTPFGAPRRFSAR